MQYNLPFNTMQTEMDESFKGNNRWPSNNVDEAQNNFFLRYAGGGESSRYQNNIRNSG